MMQQTPNYNLPQFNGDDLFNKESFNDAFRKIDTAISDVQEAVNTLNIKIEELIAQNKSIKR